MKRRKRRSGREPGRPTSTTPTTDRRPRPIITPCAVSIIGCLNMPDRSSGVPLRTLRRTHRRERVKMIDLCCGYGVNAALLNHDIDMKDLYDRCADGPDERLPVPAIVERDRSLFAGRRRSPIEAEVIGVDVAANALAYARDVGLLAEGLALDLECQDPDAATPRAARRCRHRDSHRRAQLYRQGQLRASFRLLFAGPPPLGRLVSPAPCQCRRCHRHARALRHDHRNS